jgi:hypothetical protein
VVQPERETPPFGKKARECEDQRPEGTARGWWRRVNPGEPGVWWLASAAVADLELPVIWASFFFFGKRWASFFVFF